MDVFYPVGPVCEELRYSLRSLRNLDHSRVVLAGFRPPWVRNVTHIPVDQTATRWENAFRNLVAALPTLSAQFVLMNDDFFVMSPGPIPVTHRGSLTTTRWGLPLYDRSRLETIRWLLEQGVDEPLNYELHTPMVFNRDRLTRIVSAPVFPGHIRSLYGNFYQVGGVEVTDQKMSGQILDGRFLSTTTRGWDQTPGRHIRKMFPDPSPYE